MQSILVSSRALSLCLTDSALAGVDKISANVHKLVSEDLEDSEVSDDSGRTSEFPTARGRLWDVATGCDLEAVA